ncbi:MAG: methyltransferase [Chthoniobacter sp.]|uniref:methyltransferase family protein n=1 Tax=Chthoniobacter sp. TaxID=2510640 RepID=UPI0032AB607E
MTSGAPPAPSPQGTPISERFARAAIAIERYILPWIYLWFIYLQIHTIHTNYVEYHGMVRAGFPPMSWPLFCASITRNVLLAILFVLTGIALLLNRPPKHLPTNLTHITVPLAMSYYVFLYGGVNRLPDSWREDLMPVEWRVPAAAAAVVISSIGYVISICGLCNLGRSFAILVAVRRVVTKGPYTYVRHPMYLGYLIELLGLLLSSFSPAMLLLGAGFVYLMVTRARLEEERLSEADPAYRDYMRRTGFLFPHFRSKPAIAA